MHSTDLIELRDAFEMLGVFFVLIATGTAIGQSRVDEIQCHSFLNWTIVKPKAHLGSPPFHPGETVAMNAVDGIVPNTAQGPGNGEFRKCAMTKGVTAKKSLTIDLHRTYLISSVKTYLRQNIRAVWQNGLEVYVGPNDNTHEGNTQCGSAYIYKKKIQIMNLYLTVHLQLEDDLYFFSKAMPMSVILYASMVCMCVKLLWWKEASLF